MKKLSIFLLFAALMVVGTLSAQSLDYDKLTPHPRLLLKTGDITAMRALPARSATAKIVHDRIVAESERIIGLSPVEHEKVGKRMIAVSGINRPPAVFSSAALGNTNTRSESGLIVIVLYVFSFCNCFC